MSGGLSVTVDLSGPFFRRDPGLTLVMNVQKMMQGIADEAASSAREALAQGEGARAEITELHDRLSDHVVGRTFGRPSRGGRQWQLWAKIQVYNEGLTARQGISLMAAASEVEGRTHIFRSLAKSIRSSRAALSANLTEGIE